MVRGNPLPPPVWSEGELEAQRERSLTVFVSGAGTSGRTYREIFDEAQPVVERLFNATNNLRAFGGHLFQADPELLAAARFLAGPPISEDDLETFVGGTTSRRRLANQEFAKRVADVLRVAWDPVRFPWLASDRAATPSERSIAILWTAGVWAVERTRTRLRNESSRRQEEVTAAFLASRGFEPVAGLRVIMNQDDLSRGQFVRHASLGGERGATADLSVRLHDGRILALECKVSNSGLNSIKRLIRETGGKASAWNQLFGSRVICGAVLAGVFKLGHLLDAQKDHNVTLFWEHDLSPLGDFIEQAR